MPRYEVCQSCGKPKPNSDLRKKDCAECWEKRFPPGARTPPAPIPSALIRLSAPPSSSPTPAAASSHSGSLRPKVMRFPREKVEELMNRPLNPQHGHTPRLYFTLMGLVRAWEVKEGAALGVKVKSYHVDKKTDQLVLELEPT